MISSNGKNTIISIALYFITATVCIACTTAQIPPKPQANRTVQVYPIDNYNKLHSIEHMPSSPVFNVPISAINVRFTNNNEIDTIDKKDLVLWNSEIQKTLLAHGIQIIDEDKTINLFDEIKQQNQHPSLIIDTLRVEKISESIPVPHSGTDDTMSYSYYYYIAEISACIAVHNSIVWRGSVRLTSFDLLQQMQLLGNPEILCTTITNYTYSKKMAKWIITNPVISLSDNFSKYFDNGINSDLHKQQLVSMAVTTLLSPIKGVQ
jgi:hypothetical protein